MAKYTICKHIIENVTPHTTTTTTLLQKTKLIKMFSSRQATKSNSYKDQHFMLKSLHIDPFGDSWEKSD